jgi:hypothetical protein
MNDGKNVFVCGRTGTGKSELLKRRYVHRSRRLFVYLPKREETDYPGVEFDGFEAHAFADCCQFWAECYRKTGAFRIIYRPADPFSYDEFDRVCAGIYHCGAVDFVCEDLMSYCGGSVHLGSGFKTLLTAGRTRGCQVYLVTQRPYKIPREVTSQAREACIFQSHEPADVQYVKEAFGTEAAERMGRLGQYEFIHWHETGTVEVQRA